MRYTYTALLFIIVFVLVNQSRAEDCVTQTRDSQRSIVMINDEGERDLWESEQAQDLSFCISDNFHSAFPHVEAAVREAATEWMQHGNFDFKLVDDLSCSNPKRTVLFDIRPTTRHAKFKARAFFPGYPVEKRRIQINRRFAKSGEAEFKRLMLHELGHVLGLRHEHIHEEAGDDCFNEADPFETITDYDPLSIMHYSNCGPKYLRNFVLSDLDKEGVSQLYPF